MQPSEDVFFGLVLNSSQCIIQLSRYFTGLTISINALFIPVRNAPDG